MSTRGDESSYNLAHDLELDSNESVHLASFVAERERIAQRNGFINGIVSTVIVISAIAGATLAIERVVEKADRRIGDEDDDELANQHPPYRRRGRR
jgi:hypothetical protein